MDNADPRSQPDVATTRAPAKPPGVVTLVGLLGEGDSDGSRRLYRDEAFRSWIEMKVEDIVDRFSEAGDGDLKIGRSVIWVRRDADLVRCEAVRASIFDDSGVTTTNGQWPRPGG